MTTDYSTPKYEPLVGFDPYPESEDEWRALYSLRWDQYLMSAYSPTEQKNEHLFRAFDESGNEIDQTRRLVRYFGFVADTDARALTGGRLTLETHDTSPGKAKSAELVAGEAVWRRSRLLSALPRWTRMTCVLGDWWIEPWRMEGGGVVLVGHNPQCVTSWYDSSGTQLECVEIDTSYLDEPMRERRVNGGMPTTHEYKRVITAAKVETYVDGKLDTRRSGPHPLGVVPAVHLQALAWDQPEHGLPAPFGIERALMRLDSLFTQAGAVGNRYGNPLLWTKGFTLGSSSKVSRFGRMVDGIPADSSTNSGASMGYLEAGATALGGLLEWTRDLVAHIREVTPEFLFASDAAQESAESRSLRGQAFEAKINEMRGPWFEGLCEATAMAVALDGKRALGEVVYRIDAPPVLPRNVAHEIEVLTGVETKILRVDFTRHLQRLGVVPAEADPEAYTQEVVDEQAMRATQFFDEPKGEDAPETPDEPADLDPALADVAATALNGAQMKELIGVLKEVSLKTMGPEAAKEALRIALPMIDGARIDAAVDKAAAFVPVVVDAGGAP